MNWFSIQLNLMKARLLIFGLALAPLCCVHELPAPEATNTNGGGTTPSVTCSADTVYFSNTILPLINSDCGKSGCHGTSNRNSFSLTTYSTIVTRLGSIDGLNIALQDMADKKQENPSLDYTPPNADQLTQLQKWINQGAQNNSCNSCDSAKFTYAAIIAPIMNTYCKGCHTGSSASAGVDLSTIALIQGEVNNNPGRLLGSIQWISPYTGTKEMPQGGNKLQACNITQIKKWIAAGALNN